MYLSGTLSEYLTINRQGGYLKLAFSRKYLEFDRLTRSMGKDNPINYQKATQAVQEIDDFIKASLVYDQPIEVKDIDEIVNRIKHPHLKLVDSQKFTAKGLWQAYVDFHKREGRWSESYILTHIANVIALINHPDYPQDIEKPSLVYEWIRDSGKRSLKTAKDRFKLIVAAIDWCSKNDRCDRSLGLKYRDCLSTLKVSKKKVTNTDSENDEAYLESHIDCFSKNEVEAILEAIKNETYCDRRHKGKHKQYYNYTKFLWLTGCRPGEAKALKWHNVNKTKLLFCETESTVSGKNVTRKGTKTETYRNFPINGELRELLDSMPKTSDYVFLRADGKPIEQQAFRRMFLGLLEKMGIRKRVPYQLRHSMISYHANNDCPLAKLAEIVGNSVEVIQEHYLSLDIDRISLPDTRQLD